MSWADDALAADVVRAGVRYAQAGRRVLPLAAGTKRPVWELARHGLTDATTDPDVIRMWWLWRPVPLIAAVVPDDQLVLDVDPRAGGSLPAVGRAAGTALPRTLTVISGRGDGGLHAYYRHPGGPLTDVRLPAGVDLRAGGRGYCVMPPSRHPATGRPYWWLDRHCPVAELPAAVAALLRPKAAAPRPPVGRPSAERTDRRIAKLLDVVAGAPEGTRNGRLFWAANRALEIGADLSDQLTAAAVAAGLDEREARRTIASAGRTR